MSKLIAEGTFELKHDDDGRVSLVLVVGDRFHGIILHSEEPEAVHVVLHGQHATRDLSTNTIRALFDAIEASHG